MAVSTLLLPAQWPIVSIKDAVFQVFLRLIEVVMKSAPVACRDWQVDLRSWQAQLRESNIHCTVVISAL